MWIGLLDMGEGNIQTAIKNYLKTLPRCRVINIHGSAYQEKGIADLLVCYKGLYVALEIKQDSGEPSKDQLLFLRSIRQADGIGEIVYGIEIVRDIIRCVDKGRTWKPISNLSLKRTT